MEGFLGVARGMNAENWAVSVLLSQGHKLRGFQEACEGEGEHVSMAGDIEAERILGKRKAFSKVWKLWVTCTTTGS